MLTKLKGFFSDGKKRAVIFTIGTMVVFTVMLVTILGYIAYIFPDLPSDMRRVLSSLADNLPSVLGAIGTVLAIGGGLVYMFWVHVLVDDGGEFEHKKHFLNQGEHLDILGNSSRSQRLFILSAPPRFGKTELLKKLQKDKTSEGYKVIRIDVEGHETVRDLYGKIHSTANIFMELDPVRVDGEWVEGFPKNLHDGLSKIDAEGVFFLFDNLRINAGDLGSNANVLFTTVIPKLHSTFTEIEFCRSIVAGPQLRTQLKMLSETRGDLAKQADSYFKSTRYRRLSSLFNDGLIYEYLRGLGIRYSDGVRKLLAAHVAFYSAGHPARLDALLRECIAEDFEGRNEGYVDNYFQSRHDRYIGIISTYREEVRDSLGEDNIHLFPVFQRLSMFLQYDESTLDGFFNEDEDIPYCLEDHEVDSLIAKDIKSGEELGRKLKATFLVEDKHQLYRDGITRRVLFTQQLQTGDVQARLESIYGKLHSKRTIIMHPIDPDKLRLQHFWVIEYLFQYLQKNTCEIKEYAVRQRLEHSFFNTAILNALDMYPTRDAIYAESLANFLELHAEEGTGDDDTLIMREFRFTVNYYLRLGSYTNEPYMELIDKIRGYLPDE